VNIDVVERAPARVACLHYSGPHGEPLGRFWRGTVSPWLADLGLIDCPRYGVVLDDPTSTPPEQCRYDACVELPPGLSLAGTPEALIGGGRYSITTFKGKSSAIGPAWSEFFRLLGVRGLARDPARAPMEHYPRGATYDARTGTFACQLCIPVIG
jgi:AraC family transcriptional regulator